MFPKKPLKTKPMFAAKRLFHVLALLSLCMQLTAHLSPVLAKINGNWQITICTADTVRTITIDENGNEVPTPTMRTHDCAFCASTSSTITPAHNVYVTAPTLISYKTAPTLQSDSPPLSEHGNAHATRAPPHLS